MTLLEYIMHPGTIDCPVCGETQWIDIDELRKHADELEQKGFVSVPCESCDASFVLFNSFAVAEEYTCRHCMDGEVDFIEDHFTSSRGHWTTSHQCEHCIKRNR